VFICFFALQVFNDIAPFAAAVVLGDKDAAVTISSPTNSVAWRSIFLQERFFQVLSTCSSSLLLCTNGTEPIKALLLLICYG